MRAYYKGDDDFFKVLKIDLNFDSNGCVHSLLALVPMILFLLVSLNLKIKEAKKHLHIRNVSLEKSFQDHHIKFNSVP